MRGSQVFDDFLRKRAEGLGAKIINGLFMRMEQQGADGPFTIYFNNNEGERAGQRSWPALPFAPMGMVAHALGEGAWLGGKRGPGSTQRRHTQRSGLGQCSTLQCTVCSKVQLRMEM
jgi:hypothetical protein